MGMTIGKKLFLGFLLVIAVMTIMGAVNIFLYDKAGRMYDKINDIFYANMKMDEAVTDLVQWANDLNNQLFFEKPFKKELDPYKSAFGKWYYTFKSDNPKVMNIYATMEEPYLRLHNTAQKALEFYQNGDKEGAQKIFLQELTPSFNEILEISKNLSNITIVEIERIISERRRIDRLTDMAIPTLLCIGTTLGIVMALLITRGISVQIRNAFLRITSSSHRILTFSQQQAVGIEEEATCVSENTASSKQLSLTAKQVTDYANEIAKSSVLSTDMANAGSQSVSNVVDGMDKIRQSILETAKKIEALGETSRTITEIATLIEDIADQTNLLSLNATIEATRAGEAGKGFATVADAIGKLADRTTKSTKDISLLIKEIQQDISSCIISMEQSTKETEKGASLAQEAGKKLKEIVSSFKYVAESAKKISLASQQQALGSEQISKSMINIDEIMKKSATSAKQLTNLAKELYGLAEDMKKMVGQSNLYEETTPHN